MSNDYSNSNLAGKSFRGNLSGSNFSDAEIYGTDFTGANLTGANFSKVKMGQQFHWKLVLIMLLILLAFVTGLIIGFIGAVFEAPMLHPEEPSATFWVGLGALFFLLIICLVVAIKGFGFELSVLSVATVIVIILIAVMLPSNDSAGDKVASGIFFSSAIVGGISGAILSSIVLSTAKILAGNRVIPFFLTVLVLGCAFVIYQVIEYALKGEHSNQLNGNYVMQAVAISGAVSVTLIGLSIFISNRVFSKNSSYKFIRKIVTELTSFKGTNFRGATLTNANFEKAIVKSADFRGATLKNTNWFEASFLEYSRFEETNLENSRVRKLVVTKEAAGENFDRSVLRGLNLEGANLEKVSLIGADLNETNLKDANLTRARLVNAQLYTTDLTSATLTGAYIQDWGISPRTKFKGVKCDYLFMRLPTDDNPAYWRKPDKEDETFQKGEFENFITVIIKTLEYYERQDSEPQRIANEFKTLDIFHNIGVDSKAFALAIEQFKQENPEADLKVFAVEVDDKNKLGLKVIISNEVDGEEFKGKYLKLFEEAKSKSGEQIRDLIHEDEAVRNHIRSLEKLLEFALSQKNVTITNLEGGLVMTEKYGDQVIKITDSTIHGDINQAAADSIRDSFSKTENVE
jgi:uncharacterized protein YjbI with pentapeptide repeats